MIRPIIAFVSASAMLAASFPAHAQSVDPIGPFGSAGDFETRAVVGVTIPFGERSDKAESKPRIDFRFEGARLDNDGSRITLGPPERRNLRQVELSWTIEDQPSFLLNGKAFASTYRLYADGDDEEAEDAEGEDKERTTGQKVLRGAAVAGGVMLTIVGVGLAAIVIQCNSDEGCGE